MERAFNNLAKSYNALDYPVRIASLLKSVFPSEDFDNYSKYELHERVNKALIQNYYGEELLKYKLFESQINKRNLIAAFEIKVNNSRVDFLTINGRTTSFEIKSRLDNLSKLSKQMADYLLAFEYNYLVIDEQHVAKAKDMLPDCYGLWVFKDGKYSKRKAAALNDKIEPEVQLRILTKQELAASFPENGGVLKDILKSFDASSINSQFKHALKNRYRSRWGFLVANKAQIFPIDIQFFFNTNIQPSHIYQH